ncbi:VOC family protein [Roseovarius sp. SK2]|uniref:VOC family protein n=1 Tax=unclassified Roseovarius TaxID=2614913 RepID=UPI00237AAB67|nr:MULTISPECIES: VOC family protein [unclassified Roseovarius]MDD9728235.1 VOC family protein [Roseovarius sp. SK2]
MSLGVAILKIPVSDLKTSASFYEAALGLRATMVVEEFGWAQLDGVSVALALYLPGKGGGDRTLGGTVDFHLSHNHLDELHVQTRKTVPNATVHENADGSRSLEFSDPDGNIIKVMERR